MTTEQDQHDLRAAAIEARASVTPEQRAAWNVGRDDLVNDDVWYSGFWLAEQLAGCPSEIVEKIGFSTGQRQAHEASSEGIWAVAITAVRNYRERGEWEEPGDQLAVKLLHENFGTPLNAAKLLDWLRSRPTGRHALVEALYEMKTTGTVKKPKTPWDQPTD